MAYVSRKQIIKHIEEVYERVPLDMDDRHLIAGFKSYIENLPTADVEEVRHGEWKPYFNEYKGRVTSYSCSLCGRNVKQGYLERYCHCGAKMDVRYTE